MIPTTRGGALWRFALAAVLIIGFAATTTAVAGLLQVQQLVADLSLSPPLKTTLPSSGGTRHPVQQVQAPDPGQPQTLLLIGSDHRAGNSYQSANTDTMLLVRIDPKSSTINLLSVPRDLEVQIPSGGTSYTAKLNSAYSVGGPALLVSILRSQVFQGFHVNHIIDVNFQGFSDLIDAIGCVYTDVDHRYYNNTALTGYSSINIQPGYQRLCGDNQADTGALAFVRFRHTDSDIVRNARQQDFLRWAKEGYSPAKLVANRNALLRIFGKHAQVDGNLHSLDGLLNLFNLLVFSAGHQIKQIPFPAQLSACGGIGPTGAQTPCYVTAEKSAEQQVYREFMTPTVAAAKPKARARRSRHARRTTLNEAGLGADAADGRSQALALGRAGLPVYYPRMIQNGSEYCTALSGNCNEYPNPSAEYTDSYPRAYSIHASGRSFRSYRMTLVINSGLGEYYGVQGTTWRNPPILDKPTKTQFLGGKRLLEFYQGHELALVAYRTSSGAYWISNTLTNSIPAHQMIAMAASLTLARSGGK